MASTITAHLVMSGKFPGDRFLAQTCQELHDHFGIDHATLIEIDAPNHPCTLAPEHKV